MKKIILTYFVLLFVNINLMGQNDDQLSTLVVTAKAESEEKATQSALRSAIEQAFGTFISSNTEILNDEMIKDEIISVSNGNIQNYKIISSVQVTNKSVAVTVKATVSISKLTSFVESKGGSVELKGGLFAANIKQQQLNEKSEFKAILNICKVTDDLLKKSFNYEIKTSSPVQNPDGKFDLNYTINSYSNENFKSAGNFLMNSVMGLQMSESDVNSYEQIKKETYKIVINDNEIFLRNKKSTIAIQNLILKSLRYLYNFKIVTNNKEYDKSSVFIMHVQPQDLSPKSGCLNNNLFTFAKFDASWSPFNNNSFYYEFLMKIMRKDYEKVFERNRYFETTGTEIKELVGQYMEILVAEALTIPIIKFPADGICTAYYDKLSLSIDEINSITEIKVESINH